MTRFTIPARLLALAGFLALAGQAIAQPAPTPTPAPAAPAAPPAPEAGRHETKFEYIDQSLEALLKDGFEVRTSIGPMLFLSKPGALGAARTVACTIGLTNSMMARPTEMKQAPSTCFSLN
ncbi:hypothetical protein [Roseomonas gilardii]|uniref:hypothetical protein n=1 Tax=Roseomonas gilardii TaxID=257708 RepID=UPI00048711A7|nr:hypothetical protein [Roseomonas gilardii]